MLAPVPCEELAEYRNKIVYDVQHDDAWLQNTATRKKELPVARPVGKIPLQRFQPERISLARPAWVDYQWMDPGGLNLALECILM